jgi:hypothetical protein
LITLIGAVDQVQHDLSVPLAAICGMFDPG